jgi:hypothetical protein
MIWLTNKWAQIGALVVMVMSYLAVRDAKRDKAREQKAKAQDNEKANHIRRRVDAIGELHDNAIKYRD